jgi:methyl-galactoside transport system substrate-binding protein
VAIYKFDDTFMSYVRNAIMDNSKGKASVEMVDSQNAQPTQNDQVDQFLAKKMSAIMINPVDRTAASAIIDKAKAEQSGLMQGQIAADYFKANPKAYKSNDKTIHYIMLKGEPGHQDAELRTTYSIKAITDAGIKVDKLAEDTAYWDRPKAVEKMKAFLAKFGNKIDLVLANNDDMALGAIEALRQEGYNTGNGGKYIPVVGVDATAPALQALEQGTLC